MPGWVVQHSTDPPKGSDSSLESHCWHSSPSESAPETSSISLFDPKLVALWSFILTSWKGTLDVPISHLDFSHFVMHHAKKLELLGIPTGNFEIRHHLHPLTIPIALFLLLVRWIAGLLVVPDCHGSLLNESTYQVPTWVDVRVFVGHCRDAPTWLDVSIGPNHCMPSRPTLPQS